MTEDSSSDSYVIGTAGHIDHGKSALVKALTGTDPDRLAEEKARGMTIDLGFAWLKSPRGRSVSIVDVPGHERFIKNMLAGVGGIDAALLVVAADDGPMPQTREHLAILELLQVKTGVIALTKSDLVDPGWLDLIEESIGEMVSGTFLAGAPIVRVSVVTGSGLPELLTAMDDVLGKVTRTASNTKPRLPVDRMFSLQGFGTVVTGTLLGGNLNVGSDVLVMPMGVQTRIRGLQSHSRKLEQALPGRRVAVNLAGLAVNDIHRGDVLTLPGVLRPSHRVDVRLQLLDSSPVPLEQNDGVDFFTGAAELPAWVTLLDQKQLNPGETGWVQLRFRQPVAVLKGDRFIIRRASPSLTIGGGEIIDANPIRHRRFRPEVLNSLEVLAIGTPDELLLQLLADEALDLKTIHQKMSTVLTPVQIEEALEALIAEGDVFRLGTTETTSLKPSDILISEPMLNTHLSRLENAVSEYHATFPMRRGIQREDLKSRLRLAGPAKLFDELVRLAETRHLLVEESPTIRLPEFAISLTPSQLAVADRFIAALIASSYSPPSPAEFGIDDDLIRALIDTDRIVKVSDGVFYDVETYKQIEREVLRFLEKTQTITIGSFRDHFGTSRKYAQAVLEHLDQRRITRRVGDERMRFTGSGAGQPMGGNE